MKEETVSAPFSAGALISSANGEMTDDTGRLPNPASTFEHAANLMNGYNGVNDATIVNRIDGANGGDGANGVNGAPNARNAGDMHGRLGASNKPHRPVQAPIAVVGMACRLPGHANSPQALWEFLERGGIAANRPPDSRFRLEGHYDGSGRLRTMKSPGGMFMEDVDPALFDGQFFSATTTDCIAMDPQQRQLLEVTYECLENAGVTLESVRGTSIGCFVAANAVDYEAIQARDPEDRPDSATIGVARAILSNRISHFLDIKGPSMTIDTACSGSLVSVDAACRYLDTHQADGMIVAGANMWINPEHNQEIGMMRATQSASGRCHTFDAKADGYVKAEAVNAVFLKRLDDALRDGDPVRAVIRGTAANSAGRTPGGSIASPSADAQAAAIRAAYANAGIDDLAATAYLECHGTGTLAGDVVEVAGAAAAFGPGRVRPLVIGSVKSNIGHSEAAAGISGLIKAVLAVERGRIPGNPTFLEPNPNIDFEAAKVQVSAKAVKWTGSAVDGRATPLRRASVNSFGFGGANAHVVLESADHLRKAHASSYIEKVGMDFFGDDGEHTDGAEASKRPSLLVFSANDEPSLRRGVRSLASHLLNPRVSLRWKDLAYTLSERRSSHYVRGFSISTPSDFAGESALVVGRKSSSPPRIAFVFTGQGAQWSQMGLDLVEVFPEARAVIQHLDRVLQSLPVPPSWSLLDELTQARAAETLRQPEFSQPLVTALQLAILRVLGIWNVTPASVVGHSSGEIAAAVAAGLTTPEDAIKIAYFRGQAAKAVPPEEPLGMLAVGMGPEGVQKYLDQTEGRVKIACYNSPHSLTLAGSVDALQLVQGHIQEDGHFARMLLVDLAYHSSHMAEIGAVYERMLMQDGCCRPVWPATKDRLVPPAVRMFSSTTGKLLEEAPNAAYWKKNMVSPVRFSQAATALLSHEDSAASLVIEIGPSGALAGPISQIKKDLAGDNAQAPYVAAWKRGPGASRSLFHVAGQVFLSGGPVSIAQVNAYTGAGTDAPAVLVDLPNYSWNHSIRYWHETAASRDWRLKKFAMHDLLGSKVLGTPWTAPLFKKTMRLDDLGWLRDHKLGTQVVFPGAGYIAMAAEAAYQATFVTEWKEKAPTKYRLLLRDVRFMRALAFDPETPGVRVTLSLTPVPGTTKPPWLEFRVASSATLEGDVWTEHARGLVRAESDFVEAVAPAAAISPLQFPIKASSWYKAMAAAGYDFGPAFRKHVMVEATTGQRQSRSTVSLEAPASSYEQSFYPMHPACIDGCFQTVSPALWAGDKTNVDAVLVPQAIRSLTLYHDQGRRLPAEAVSVASASYIGIGRTDTPRNYEAHCTVSDPDSGAVVFQMDGLRFGQLETNEDDGPQHTFTRQVWRPDITMLAASPTSKLDEMLKNHRLQDLVDLVVHKSPRIRVLEMCQGTENTASVWLQAGSDETSGQRFCVERDAALQFHMVLSDPKALVAAMDRYAPQAPGTAFSLESAFAAEALEPEMGYDLAIITVAEESTEEDLSATLAAAKRALRSGAMVIVANTPGTAIQESLKQVMDMDVLHRLDDGVLFGRLASAAGQKAEPDRPVVKLVRFLGQETEAATRIVETLGAQGWDVRRTQEPRTEVGSHDVVLVLDELTDDVAVHLDAEQWELLQHLIRTESRVLWATTGAQMAVEKPDRAAVNGLFRVVRAEEPGAVLVTLDVQMPTDAAQTAGALAWCLGQDAFGVAPVTPGAGQDYEFVERAGVVYTSRIVPDRETTALQSEEMNCRPVEAMNLHRSETTVRLRAERLGNVDSVHYGEAAPARLPLGDGCIEVEIYAAGLNYKDVVVTMGIVPGNEHTLGGEGAGIVTRVSPGAAGSFEVGQRVVVFDKGTFGNRVQTTPGRVHGIPDWMTFEEAATLSAVYLTVLYSLIDLANLRTGQSVLIHSAAGGVGIAAIQVARYLGAEIYATVGTDEKRQYLKSQFGLADERIFSSRSADFAGRVRAVTGGRGVDVVLNSLTGHLLDESWRLLADGGVLVELGKKDILDRNSLAMEPFDRNISFRAVDMSHERAPDTLVARLLAQLFRLIGEGHLKPIAPIHPFSFSDVPSAIRFLRAGKHIGKVVITDGASPDPNAMVPVRKAPAAIGLRPGASYLIVGGLKGLCGSLAVFLAKNGAKHLAILARSGYQDPKSQGVVREIEAQGCRVQLLVGDVSVAGDVEAAVGAITPPLGGIIQGAMVLRDRVFASMTVEEYHAALACKVRGTWCLHEAASRHAGSLDFFTLLSSISGVVGQKGQANYAAANAVLDAFAAFRRGQGLAACAVDLGVIEDVGYIHERDGMQQKLDTSIWTGIDEKLLRRILYLSLVRQQRASVPADGAGEAAQMITGIPVPQPADSPLARDVRFAGLFTPGGAGAGARHEAGTAGSSSSSSQDVKALLLLLRSKTGDRAAQTAATVNVVMQCFMRILRLPEPMEPSRPLSVYGIDSLAAVEVRNWIRGELGALVTTLDIINAPSLVALCEKVVTKVTA